MKEWICREISTATKDAENGILIRETELIRCKDCKHWKLERYVGGEGMACQFMPSDGNVNLTKPTDYCCWAERKEE